MYDLSQAGYSESEVFDLLRSDRTVYYRYDLLSRNDIPIGNVTATGTINCDATATIKRVASLNIKEANDIDFLNEKIKPYMCLETSRGMLQFPLGVFLMSSPSRTGGTSEREVDCYDKTQILCDDKFTSRYRIPKGTNYVAAVGTILQSAGIVQYYIDASPLETAKDIEYAVGTRKIDAINQLLTAINYNELYVDALGQFHAERYKAPDVRLADCYYATDRKSIVMSGASEYMDAFSVPNTIVRYLEDADRPIPLISTAVNTDAKSALSTISRGRVIVDAEPVDDIADQATLDAYTQRLLAESKLYQQVIFKTANMPHHSVNDCLFLANKDLNIAGKYIETSWSMELVTGGIMTHTCMKAVSL